MRDGNVSQITCHGPQGRWCTLRCRAGSRTWRLPRREPGHCDNDSVCAGPPSFRLGQTSPAEAAEVAAESGTAPAELINGHHRGLVAGCAAVVARRLPRQDAESSGTSPNNRRRPSRLPPATRLARTDRPSANKEGPCPAGPGRPLRTPHATESRKLSKKGGAHGTVAPPPRTAPPGHLL